MKQAFPSVTGAVSFGPRRRLSALVQTSALYVRPCIRQTRSLTFLARISSISSACLIFMLTLTLFILGSMRTCSFAFRDTVRGTRRTSGFLLHRTEEADQAGCQRYDLACAFAWYVLALTQLQSLDGCASPPPDVDTSVHQSLCVRRID